MRIPKLISRLRTRWRWYAMPLFVLLALTLWWVRDDHGQAQRWLTVTIDRGDIQLSISATGNLKALSTVDVGSQVSGQVLSVEVDFNDLVKSGQVIARIDPANFLARQAQAEADLTAAEAGLRAARANYGEALATLRNLEADYERKQQLFTKKLISRSEFDTALAARDQGRARVASAEAGIEVARSQVVQRRAALENAKLDVHYSTIRSPVDGVVIARSVEPGQTVTASFQTPVLFSIAEDLRQMQIDLSVDEADVGRLRQGLPVRFTVDAFPEREYHGKIRQVRLAATNVANVITYPVVVAVDNADGSLLPGMTANAEVLIAQRHDVPRLANAALRWRPRGMTGTARAGTPGNDARPGGNPMVQWDELAQRLHLDAAQQEQMRAAITAAFQGLRGQLATLDETQRRRKIAGAIRSTLQPLRARLDDSQRELLDAELEILANARRVTVWVLQDGKPEQRTLRIGLSDDSHSEVLAGLAPGDQVIVGEQVPNP